MGTLISSLKILHQQKWTMAASPLGCYILLSELTEVSRHSSSNTSVLVISRPGPLRLQIIYVSAIKHYYFVTEGWPGLQAGQELFILFVEKSERGFDLGTDLFPLTGMDVMLSSRKILQFQAD